MSRPKKNYNRQASHGKTPEPRSRKDQIARLLGAKDTTFADYKYWNSLTNKLNEVVNLYGFNRLETPIIENLNLYKKSPKFEELYFFGVGRGDKMALRPDLTHGLARAFLEQDMSTLPQPVKMFAYGPVFRQENKLQSGVYRQFNQFSLEIFGESKPIGETLLMAIVYNIFRELQINVQIQINSVGDFDCQKEYLSKLTKFYREKIKKTKMCPNCKKNFLKNPLSLLSCEDPVCQEVKKEAPQITNFLSEESNNYFTHVLEYLDELEINYNFDPYLVKGLNYYTETIFEIWPLDDNNEVDGKLARYNNLVEQLGGASTPAVGFTGGVERTVAKLKEKNLLFKKDDNIIFVAQVSDQARLRAFDLFNELHKAGFKVRQALTTDDLKEQLEEAKRLEAKIILILGKKEVSNETILFRDVEEGVQEVITQKDLKERLHKRFGNK